MNFKTPSQFQAYDKVKSSEVGNNGIIKIELATDTDSKTFIKDLQTKAPLLIQKAMYPDTEFPKLLISISCHHQVEYYKVIKWKLTS